MYKIKLDKDQIEMILISAIFKDAIHFRDDGGEDFDIDEIDEDYDLNKNVYQDQLADKFIDIECIFNIELNQYDEIDDFGRKPIITFGDLSEAVFRELDLKDAKDVE